MVSVGSLQPSSGLQTEPEAPGHLGACWRLGASGPPWGSLKQPGGWQERPAPWPAVICGTGSVHTLPPAPSLHQPQTQLITCVIPHLPTSPSPSAFKTPLQGHLTLQPQFPQVRMRIKMPTSGIHIQGESWINSAWQGRQSGLTLIAASHPMSGGLCWGSFRDAGKTCSWGRGPGMNPRS